MLKFRKAFTLIELLIVVAIIAILAAIAVPNFLEAQTRAKVARVKSDLRTMAVAIESYTVDYNTPPPNGIPARRFPAPPHRNFYGYMALTTPIAYLSAWVFDTFRPRGAGATFFTFHSPVSIFYLNTDPPEEIDTDPNYPIWQGMMDAGVTWMAYSLGPSQIWNNYDGVMVEMGGALAGWPDVPTQMRFPSNFYDPTNGAISHGRICRTNRGQEPVKSSSTPLPV